MCMDVFMQFLFQCIDLTQDIVNYYSFMSINIELVLNFALVSPLFWLFYTFSYEF